MRSAGQDRQAILARGRRGALPQAQQLTARFVEASMRLGRDFDLRLQELPLDTTGGAAIGDLKECVRCLGRRGESFTIGKKVLFLDAALKQCVGGKGMRLVTRRNKRADTKSPLAWIELKFHARSPLAVF